MKATLAEFGKGIGFIIQGLAASVFIGIVLSIILIPVFMMAKIIFN